MENQNSSNGITIMENPKFGQVRKVLVNSEWYYVATDIAKALEYVNPRDAVLKHCRCVAKRDIPHPQSPSKTLEVSVIPKGDVLRLISESHLPAAQEFNHWLFDDVAVQAVETGMYMSPEALDKLFTSPQFISKLFTQWDAERKLRIETQTENERLQAKVDRDAPKVYFADGVFAADGDILIGDLAKLLHQNGLDIGRDRLFARLREDGYLIKGGKSRNLPTQKSVSCGLMRVRESLRATGNSNPNTFLTPVITGKGQRYFVHKYCYEPFVFAVQQ